MHGLVAAQPLKLALLQHTQQLHLDRPRHVADLVQKHGAGIGLLELSGLGRIRSGERAFLVSEQLALHQVFGNRGAVDLDERTILARGMLVDGARDHILAHAAFPASSTVARVGATRVMVAKISCMGALCPMMFSNW